MKVGKQLNLGEWITSKRLFLTYVFSFFLFSTTYADDIGSGNIHTNQPPLGFKTATIDIVRPRTVQVTNLIDNLDGSIILPFLSSFTESDPLSPHLTDTQTIFIRGNFAGEYNANSTNPVIELAYKDLGAGITITSITVKSYEADPDPEFTGDLKYCDNQSTGAFPGASPTVLRAIDTTTGNYSSGAITDIVPTGKQLYVSMDAAPATTQWSIKITYTIT